MVRNFFALNLILLLVLCTNASAIVLDVIHQDQHSPEGAAARGNYCCGPTAVNMATAWIWRAAPSSQFLADMCIGSNFGINCTQNGKKGTDTSETEKMAKEWGKVKYAEKFDDKSKEDIISLIRYHVPVAYCIRYLADDKIPICDRDGWDDLNSHAILIIGYDDMEDQFIYHDPLCEGGAMRYIDSEILYQAGKYPDGYKSYRGVAIKSTSEFNRGNIDGYVYTNHDIPYEDVSVCLDGNCNTTKIDSDGYFYIGNFETGLHTLTLERKGHKLSFRSNEGMHKDSMTIEVNENRVTRCDKLYVACDNPSSFTDVPCGAWYLDYLESLRQRDVINGYLGGTYCPDGFVRRAEFLKMIVKASAKTCDSDCYEPSFNDVKPDDWFYEFVKIALNVGWITPAPKFEPEKYINRAEASKLIVKALGGKDKYRAYRSPTDIEFTDDGLRTPSIWYYSYVYICTNLGIVKGYPDGKFYPERNLNRAESAKIICNAFFDCDGSKLECDK